MSISFPLFYPGVSGFASIEWIQDRVQATSQSPYTLAQQRFDHMGERWRAKITLPAMQRENASAWRAWVSAVSRSTGSFYLGDPYEPIPRGLALGSPTVSGGSQTGRTLVTTGWAASITGILLAGDWIQVGTRLYMVQTDCNSDASGNATLELFPRVSTAPSNGATVVTNSPVGLFRISPVSSRSLHRVTSRRVYDAFAFECVEANQ